MAAQKKRKFPDAISILLLIMLIFIGLTWLIPAGEYDTELSGKREIVVPDTYHEVDKNPQGIIDFFLAPIKGFAEAGQIIAFCFLVGGAFGILNRTGAIDAALNRVIEFSKKKKESKKWVLVMIMLVFSVFGATFGMSESVLVFILITIPLALALGYDSVVGISISFLAAGVGFAGALTNPFTIGVAQGIAGITLFSGWEYRLVIWVLLTTIAVIYVLAYANKIEKDPTKSSVHDIDKKRKKEETINKDLKFNLKRKLILILLFAALVLIIAGSNLWSWYINEIAGVFIGMGMISAVIYRLSASKAVKAFIDGAKGMVMAALVIGLAKGLLIIASDGKIIGTMLYSLSEASSDLPKTVSVQFMFLFQGILNFFIPSGSGQAALTMPVMAPLSDLIGVSRQTAVLCFQMGDGIFNMIIPTSGVTMGVLSIAKIPYVKWIKWLWPLILILTIAVILLLIPPVLFFEYA